MMIKPRSNKTVTVIDQDAIISPISCEALGLYTWLVASRRTSLTPADAITRFNIDQATFDSLVSELQGADLIEVQPS